MELIGYVAITFIVLSVVVIAASFAAIVAMDAYDEFEKRFKK